MGRLTPLGMAGALSPAASTACTTRALMPTTFSFLKALVMGELSSNHWACPLSVRMRLVASTSFSSTSASYVPRMLSGSP